jgi:hypothetical protein
MRDRSQSILKVQLGAFGCVPQPPQTCRLDNKRFLGGDCSYWGNDDGSVQGNVFRPLAIVSGMVRAGRPYQSDWHFALISSSLV